MAEPPAEGQESSENLPEAAPHSTADYEKFGQLPPGPVKPERNWGKLVTYIILAVVLIAIGAGAYWYFNIRKPAPKPAASTAQTTTGQTSLSATSQATKTYSSTNLNLSFSYPADWIIVDNNGTSLTATSPLMQLKDISGQAVQGRITMTIQNSQPSSLPGFSKGNATAVLASQKITYAKPTQDQRANTYVTFITYSTTAGSNALDAIYISGDNGYTLGQAVPQADLIQVSPIVSLTFTDSTGKALTLASSEWNNSSFSTPLLNMLKSLSIT